MSEVDLSRRARISDSRRSFTLFAASLVLICCFIFSSAPIPLIGVWAGEMGLTTAEVAMTVVSYFFGCIVTLVFFARLSNALGRRWVTLITIGWAAVSCWCYAVMTDTTLFYIARFTQGIACGLASSAAMSWIVDCSPKKHAWIGTALTAGGPNVGLSIGTLLSGVLTAYGLVNIDVMFMSFVVICVLLAALVWKAEGTIPPGTETLVEVLIPKVALPGRLWRIFLVTGFAMLGTWGLGSFLQGFSAKLAETAFGATSTMYAAIVYMGLIVPNAAAGFLMGSLRPSRVFPIAVTCFTAAGALLFLFLETGHPSLFLTALIASGACSGSTSTLGVKFLLQDSTLRERAGVIAALYLSCYVGSGIPNFVVSRLAADVSMDAIYLGYIGWITGTWLLSLVFFFIVKKSNRPAERLRFSE